MVNVRCRPQIRVLITKSNMRLNTLASEAGCSEGHLSRVVAGHAGAGPELRAFLIQRLGCSFDDAFVLVD